MSSVPHAPPPLPVRILGLGGLIGLGVLTLAERSATRMFATPWVYLLTGVLALPLAGLLMRLTRSGRWPSPAWLGLAAATAIIPVASALLSPYRGASLLHAAWPLAAAALFLWLHAWLQDDPARNPRRLEQALALAAGLLALGSTLYWLRDVTTLTRAEFFSPQLFQIRNSHPLGHANYTAGLMLLGLPWLVQLAWRQPGWPRRLALLATALALLNLFTSGSRGGLLGLAALGVAGVAAAALSWKRFVLIAVGTIAVVSLLAFANPRIRALVGPIDPRAAPNLSNVQRVAMLEGGALMGRDRPLLGWGPGTTPLAYPRYRHALDGGAENVLQLHSTPVQLWAETGATGLLAALLLGGLVLRHWRRSPPAAAALAGYAAFALTDYQLDLPVFAALVAASLALLAPPATAPANPQVRAALGLIVVLAAGLITLLGARDRTPTLNSTALQLARDPAQHDRAIALLAESLALNPDQEIAHFNLGWLLVVSDPVRAERHFRAAARLVPDKGGVYFGLGLARLNQGRAPAAARAFALECVNDPRFLASPWWTVPEIAAQREAARAEYDSLLSRSLASPRTPGVVTWWQTQAGLLRTLAPRLGQVSPGPETAYRRERTGYPVLTRQPDLAPPLDLYDVREDPRFPASVTFPLPSKGWLPSCLLLMLLDEPPLSAP